MERTGILLMYIELCINNNKNNDSYNKIVLNDDVDNDNDNNSQMWL